ncbi:hypothetical protein [Thioclava sp. SK-1]|nr:hypothetical protein [Thioclava sp. SK-1]
MSQPIRENDHFQGVSLTKFQANPIYPWDLLEKHPGSAQITHM